MKKALKYDFKKIEKKWQRYWQDSKTNEIDLDNAEKPFYNLMMFPYPSAEGLHVGSVYTFTGVDTFGRFKRMQGYDVFQPIGLDGFGIHSENYAMKIGQHIKDVSFRTEKNFYRQLRLIGNMYDWNRTVETYKPNYYKWTQWLFLQMYKKGLAYRKKAKVNWCPSCKTVLSDEQVIAERCERCDSKVIKKKLNQWFFLITKYADKLLKNLNWINWPEDVKTNQRNWIGKSEGATIRFSIVNFQLSNRDKKIANRKSQIANFIEVFTTRPDTIFGATYMVIAPEHKIISDLQSSISNYKEVEKYLKKSLGKSEQERKVEEKEKTGVELGGIKAINPATGEGIPIWVADYVLGDYGTGAIMAVPAHDERDFEFARKYKLPIKYVVEPYFCDNGISDSSVKPNKRIERREAVCAVVRNPKNEKYLCIKWKRGVKMHGLVTGGIREKEDIEKAARREILEETGYQNLKLKSIPSLAINTVFYHRVKKINRWDHFHYVFFDLIDEQKNKINEKKTALHEVVWKEKKELGDFFTVFEGNYAAELIKSGSEKPFCKEGVTANSDFLDGLETEKAKKKIIKWLEEKKFGGKAVDYKLRDWCVSRQRYWGPPIPIVFCGSCALKELKKQGDKILKINFHNRLIWDQILDGMKTVETRALNPEEKDRYFGDVKTGDKIIFKNKNTNKERAFEIKNVEIYQDLGLLFKEKDLVKKAFPGKKFETLDDFRKIYAGLAEGNLEKIEKNGLVAWEIEEYKIPVPVKEKDLPVLLPPMSNFLPEGRGKGPLAKNEKFVKTKCPVCGGEAERETDVSDPFVDSSWYFLRYPSTEFDDKVFDKKRMKKWLPVDSYIGGKEHTVLHLLYSRFVTMVLNDLGYIDFDEPYKRFFSHGLITKDGAKMSKSKGNVVNPDEMIEKYGADTTRLYMRFLGDFSQGGDWRDNGIAGMHKFVNRLWVVFCGLDKLDGAGAKNMSMLDKTVKAVGEDIERLSFNTAVARVMEFVNWIKNNQNKFSQKQAGEIRKTLALVLAPMVPHLAEEFWLQAQTNTDRISVSYKSIFNEKWPEYDPKKIIDNKIELVIQVNSRVRDKIKVSKKISKKEAEKLAIKSEKVKKYTEEKEIKKIIYVPGRLINLVVS